MLAYKGTGLRPAGEIPTSPKGGREGKEKRKDQTIPEDCACSRNERQSHNGNCLASESTAASRSTAAFERVGRFGRWRPRPLTDSDCRLLKAWWVGAIPTCGAKLSLPTDELGLERSGIPQASPGVACWRQDQARDAIMAAAG